MSSLLEIIKAAAELPGVLRLIAQASITALIVAGVSKAILTWFPRLPGDTARALRAGAVRLQAGGHRILQIANRSITPKHPVERRWEKPFWLGFEFLAGAFYALVMFVFSLDFFAIVAADSHQLPLWKTYVAIGCGAVLMFFTKVFAVRAQDAWFQLRNGLWRN